MCSKHIDAPTRYSKWTLRCEDKGGRDITGGDRMWQLGQDRPDITSKLPTGNPCNTFFIFKSGSDSFQPLTKLNRYIQILPIIYILSLCDKMFFTENHRTQTNYEDALVIKLFAFSFANSYASCFYIAFFREVSIL